MIITSNSYLIGHAYVSSYIHVRFLYHFLWYIKVFIRQMFPKFKSEYISSNEYIKQYVNVMNRYK